MSTFDLFTLVAIIASIALVAIVIHAIWRLMREDLHLFEERLEEDEHATGLTAPWNRRKR